jgi:hypothetical protein
VTAENEFKKGWDSFDSKQATGRAYPTPESKSATKKDLRYVNNEAAFLNYSYDVFGKYFSDRDSFLAFYNKINATDEKNKFLRISSFYKFIVIDGRFLNTKDKNYNEYIDYFDFTYKYIAFFSLIEALYTKDDYKEFYGWLRKNKDCYPIGTKQALDNLYETYNQIYGSTRKAIRFFKSLDDKSKKLIQDKFEVRKGGQSFTDTDFAKLFYKIRNNFIHNADLVVQFNNTQPPVYLNNKTTNEAELAQYGISPIPASQTYFTIGNKEILSSLSFDDIKLIFERGFLIYFGYNAADFKPKKK